MSLFRLDASILPGTSTSAELADLLETEYRVGRPDEPVVRRVLGTDPLPAQAWAQATVGGFTPEGDRTAAQRDALALATQLAGELTSADAVLLAVPLYNFGVSQHFKTWMDLVIAGVSPNIDGLLKGKPTVLAVEATGRALPARAGTTPLPTCGAFSATGGRPTSRSSNVNSPLPLPPLAWKTSRTWPLSGTPRPWPPPATPAAPLSPNNRCPGRGEGDPGALGGSRARRTPEGFRRTS